MNYFKLLALDKKYNIDLQLLHKQYLVAQVKYHPDKARSPREKRQFQDISTELNKAYGILKDDLKRAEYLLNLEKLNISNNDLRGKISSDKLLEIWTDREIVENTEDIIQLNSLYNLKITEQKNLITNLSKAFEDKNLQYALDITVVFKYLINLIDSIKLKIKNANSRN